MRNGSFYESIIGEERASVLCVNNGDKIQLKEIYEKVIKENIIESVQEGFVKMWGKTLIIKLETAPFVLSRYILLDSRNLLDFYSVIENVDPEWAALIFSIWFGQNEEEV